MKNYIKKGNAITCIAAAIVTSGQLVLVGSLHVVANTDAAIGEEFEGDTVGVFRLPKVLANTTTIGAKAYLLTATGEVTTSATASTLCGVFVSVEGSSSTHANVRLSGTPA